MTLVKGISRRSVALGLLALPAVLAACGKKNDPRPPSGDEAPYPREYPKRSNPPPLNLPPPRT